MAQGTAEEIAKVSDSITGQYLSGRKSIPVPKKEENLMANLLKLLEPKSII